MSRPRSHFRLAVLLVLAGGGALGGGCSRSPATTYSLDVTYTAQPDYLAVEQRLKDRGGWRDVSVTHKGDTLSIGFGTDQPPDPAVFREVMAECERAGYGGRSGYSGTISDRSQQGTNWHTLWVEYTTLPADDGAVATWLAAQPGVGEPTVRREGNVVVFEYTLADPPPATLQADITKRCTEAGYQGQLGHVSAIGRYR